MVGDDGEFVRSIVKLGNGRELGVIRKVMLATSRRCSKWLYCGAFIPGNDILVERCKTCLLVVV